MGVERINICLRPELRRVLDRLARLKGGRSAAIASLLLADRDREVELEKLRLERDKEKTQRAEHERLAVEARERGKTTRAEHRRVTQLAATAARRILVEREIYRDLQRRRAGLTPPPGGEEPADAAPLAATTTQ